MEKSRLTEVKAILKSLVLSSTDKMTIEQLNRDYRDIEGQSIPFRLLGYASIEEFLRAIPDTLRVFGSGPTAMVCFVANEKSDHIHDMIMKQKKPRTRTRNRNRVRDRSRSSKNNKFNNDWQPVKNKPDQQLSPFQSVNRTRSVRTVKLWNGPPPKVTSSSAPNFCGLPQPSGNNIYGNATKVTSSSAPNFCGLPQPSGINLHENANVKAKQGTNLNNYEEHFERVINLLKDNCFITHSPSPPPPLPLSKATTNGFKTEKPPSNKETKTKIDSTTKATTTASTNANNFWDNIKPPKPKENSQPRKLSSDIEKLLTMRRHVKHVEPIKENNNDSASDSTCEGTLNKMPKDTDFELKQKVKNKLFDIENEQEEQKDEAVPSFAAKYNVFRLDFPDHTVPYGNKIAPYKIPTDIAVDSCIKIFVSEIHSPFRFWFHIYKEEHELDLLMYQMERYYSSLGADDLCIPLTSLVSGQVCAAKYNDMWHRAEIVTPPIGDTIKVSFMDYGTVTEVKIEEVKFLASYFGELPAQAMRGCLSHIKPRQLHWSHEAIVHFLNLTSDRMLYAKITEIDTQNRTFYMIICNTHGEEVIQINTSLVEHHYASLNEAWKTEKIKMNNGKRVHHPREDFPTFSMIELGEYPNLTELFNLQRVGIDYEALYDKILYNQTSILNKHENVPEVIRQLPYFLTTTNPFRSDIILELFATTTKAV